MPESESDHYFSAKPGSSGKTSIISVRLANKDVAVETAGGIFSPEHIDVGTQALLYTAPKPPATGTFLDIGCGWGPLALTLGMESPEAVVYAIDVNERAVELTARNAKRLGVPNVKAMTPQDVPNSTGFDLIWSNPPIRVGKQELHAILETWIPRLNPSGAAYLVVAKHLGADSLEKWLGETFRDGYVISRDGTRKGFRVLEIIREAR